MNEMDTTAGAGALTYKRVVLKLSGEVLGNRERGESIDADILEGVCAEVKKVVALGAEVALVIGGGNIFRGLSGSTERGVDRTTGDHMGMLATVINALALGDCLRRMDVPVIVQSAIPMERVCEPFIQRNAMQHLAEGRVVIFGGGTGNPFFSTDTTAALRASEIGADVILKATKVDGVYDKDPMKHTDAVRYEHLTFDEALLQGIAVMDAAAFALCRENDIPILVFRMSDPDAMQLAVMGEAVGTVVRR